MRLPTPGFAFLLLAMTSGALLAQTLPTPGTPDAAAADHRASVREFFAALEAMDIPRFLALWAEDGVQEMPFAPAGFPARLEGRAAIARQYGPLPAAYTGMAFPLRSLRATEDPRVVVV